MTPLTHNFVKQLVVASASGHHIPLDPAELRELAEVWITFHKVMQAIVQPDAVKDSVADLYKELAESIQPKTHVIVPSLSLPG